MAYGVKHHHSYVVPHIGLTNPGYRPFGRKYDPSSSSSTAEAPILFTRDTASILPAICTSTCYQSQVGAWDKGPVCIV